MVHSPAAPTTDTHVRRRVGDTIPPATASLAGGAQVRTVDLAGETTSDVLNVG
ncbi:hypothetical protein ABZT06_26170 [Streptomyces sp. NPDC005483]|uniref:hypothetical protein n=1 Tax=Streptomyces sp. NPDC005483 TaxID=3154882 RepID=UPI0033B2558D